MSLGVAATQVADRPTVPAQVLGVQPCFSAKSFGTSDRAVSDIGTRSSAMWHRSSSGGRLFWVELTRPRAAASEHRSLSVSCAAVESMERPGQADPLPPFELLQTCQSSEPGFIMIRVQKADLRGHQGSAICGPPSRCLSLSRAASSDDSFLANYSHLGSPRPGHKLPDVVVG